MVDGVGAWDCRVCCEQAEHVSFSQSSKAAPAEEEEEEEEYALPTSPTPANLIKRKMRDPVFSRIPIAVRYMRKAHSPVAESLSMGGRLMDPRRFDANWGLGLRFWPSVDNKPFFLKAWKHVLPMQAHIWWHIYVRMLSSLPFVLITLLDEDPTVVEALVAFHQDARRQNLQKSMVKKGSLEGSRRVVGRVKNERWKGQE